MLAPIERILDEAATAINRRVAVNSNIPGGEFSSKERQGFSKALRSYRAAMKSLDKAVQSGDHKRKQLARKRVIDSFGAKLVAVVRAAGKHRNAIPSATLESWAQDLSLDTAYHETVRISPLPKGNSFRPICMSGPRRKAQQLLIRDMQLVEIGDAGHDSTVRGAGGEAQLFADIRQAIAEDYFHWVELDIRDNFPSLRPEHLSGFPLPAWTIRNLVFLPVKAPIKFTDPLRGIELTHDVLLGESEVDWPDSYPYSVDTVRSKVKQVRQGLPQGDACAPQMARTVLGWELRHVLEKRDVIYGSHLDNVIIGARS